ALPPRAQHVGVDGGLHHRLLLFGGGNGVVCSEERLDGVVDEAARPHGKGRELLETLDLRILVGGVVGVVVAPSAGGKSVVARSRPRERRRRGGQGRRGIGHR